MIEFLGAFLGALTGVCITIGVYTYKTSKDLEKALNDLTSIALLSSAIKWKIKAE